MEIRTPPAPSLRPRRPCSGGWRRKIILFFMNHDFISGITQNSGRLKCNRFFLLICNCSNLLFIRQEAKDIVRNSVGASEHDVVIFCGFGCTGAVHKLVQAVMGENNKKRPPPVVFVGPFEHHSSFIPWKDAGAKVGYLLDCNGMNEWVHELYSFGRKTKIADVS